MRLIFLGYELFIALSEPLCTVHEETSGGSNGMLIAADVCGENQNLLFTNRSLNRYGQRTYKCDNP